MKLKIWILLLITSASIISCGEKKVESINLENAIFKAEGNNPSWKLEIDSNNGIHFYSNSKMDKIITPSSKLIEIMDVAATSYHSETESAKIKVEIFRKQCINSETHSETKYEVRVKAKNNADSEYTSLKGCGEFFADKKLNGKWELQKLNGVELAPDNFMRGLPFIQFDLEKLHISGNSGCNNFNGEFSFVGRDILVDKNMMSTRMACPTLNFESEFLKALTSSSLMYSLENNILTMKKGNVLFELKRIK